MKVDSTKELLRNPRLVLDEASERYTAARAGMTGKKEPAHTTSRSNVSQQIRVSYLLRRCRPVSYPQ